MVSTLGISEFKQQRFWCHASTGSELFSLLIRVDGTKYVLLKDCLIKTLFKITTLKCKNSLLPVDEPEVEPFLSDVRQPDVDLFQTWGVMLTKFSGKSSL